MRQDVHEATAPDDKQDCEKAGRVWDDAGKKCLVKQSAKFPARSRRPRWSRCELTELCRLVRASAPTSAPPHEASFSRGA